MTAFLLAIIGIGLVWLGVAGWLERRRERLELAHRRLIYEQLVRQMEAERRYVPVVPDPEPSTEPEPTSARSSSFVVASERKPDAFTKSGEAFVDFLDSEL